MKTSAEKVPKKGALEENYKEKCQNPWIICGVVYC